jgi:pimeloyl-ACP methyl ester carboxylesterase
LSSSRAAEWRPVFSSPRTEFIAVDALRMRIVRHGDGPPLLLINGLGAPAEMWLPLVRHLKGYELITFDMPGCGRSSTPRFPLGMRALASIAATVMHRAGHAQAHVLGYSLGGLVAQEMAYRHPECVDRLVLCATTPGFPSLPPRPLAAWLMLTPSRYVDRAAAEMIVPMIAGGRTSRDREVLDANLPARLAHAPSLVGYLNQLYAAGGFTSHPWIRFIKQSTMIIAGDDDPLVPVPNARYLAWAIPNARLQVMRGAGHLMLIDEPRTAGGLISGFLEE